MNQSKTVTGKLFYYDGSTETGLTVYPTDREGIRRSGSRVPIAAADIAFIRGHIRSAGEIPMGACRDKPAPGSLGDRLRARRKSPQILSYVIPLLAEQGFCSYRKSGRRYIISRNVSIDLAGGP